MNTWNLYLSFLTYLNIRLFSVVNVLYEFILGDQNIVDIFSLNKPNLILR